MKCTFETREGTSKMNIWVEPLEWDAEEEGKASNVVEKIEEEDTKDTEEVKNIEAEEKKQEPPIFQIVVEVQNFIGGEPVRPSRAIRVLPQENCASSFISPVICADIVGGKGCCTGPSRIAR